MSDRTPRSARMSPHRLRGRAPCALAALLCAASASAEEIEAVRHIADNSFLVEEAHDQEDGVVHNAAMFVRDRLTGDWTATLTQEWPVVNEDHQFSYTLALSQVTAGKASTGFGARAGARRARVDADLRRGGGAAPGPREGNPDGSVVAAP